MTSTKQLNQQKTRRKFLRSESRTVISFLMRQTLALRGFSAAQDSLSFVAAIAPSKAHIGRAERDIVRREFALGMVRSALELGILAREPPAMQ